MGNHKKRVLKKRIKRMILLPVLIALILFCVGEIATRKVKESQTYSSGDQVPGLENGAAFLVELQEEDGNIISADIVIDRDRAFTPIYR